LALLFLRAFFLRAFFAIVGLLFVARRQRLMVVGAFGSLGIPPRRIHDWILSTDVDEGDSAMAEEIRAEMVANVWKVVASAGDEVAEGDTLVILESMKMEIPVLAESDGTVSQLAVNEGDVVQEGDLIAVIDD
jgi:acetyl/propionyl-CoA carboxylase alpha subunit